MRMTWTIFLSISAFSFARAAEPKFVSHPPTRPLPTPSQRALAEGPGYFVDPAKGDDGNDGSLQKPWKTVQHAVRKLKPGDTLYLRGGIYYEHPTLTVSGTPDKPITLRSYEGELAILDGGLREFLEQPAKCWEPCPGGVAGEYWSAKAYPGLGAGPDSANVRGFFADSMIPFHGYRYANDHRDPSMVWDLTNKVGATEGVYCGPGVYYDTKTGRFHARLAHTTIKALGNDNFRGETDPRKVPLVLATVKTGSTLTIKEAHDLRFQDLVVRGSATSTVEVGDSARIVFDGVTIYGGHTCIRVRDSTGLRFVHSACRGQAAPWTFRGHLKYRSTESQLFSASGWSPTGADNRDFELAYSEFTDSVDGVFIGSVRGVHFHHNLLDNVSDDGIFLTAGTGYDGTTPGGDVHIYQNLLSRCLTTFAFGVGKGRQKAIPAGRQSGAGVNVHRNVFDFRRPVHYQMPADLAKSEELPSHGRFAADHGGPLWEPMNVYHNTILADDPGARAYGTWGFGGHLDKGTKWRVFNNIVCQMHGMPGVLHGRPEMDLHIDGNLLWSIGQGPQAKGDPLAAFRTSKMFEASKATYAPGWSAHDRLADPKFVRLDANWRTPLDVRLQETSPCIDAGVPIPADWPDSQRAIDKGKPDIGAIPLGGEPWRIGMRGRLTVFGDEKPLHMAIAFVPREFSTPAALPPANLRKPAVIVQGYPARELPLLEFALRRHGARFEVLDHAWLDVADYAKHGLVVLTGNLLRAGIKPNNYSREDLQGVRRYLEGGGALFLTQGTADVFATPEGREFLTGLVGKTAPEPELKIEVLQPGHPWVKHFDPQLSQRVLPVPPDPQEKPKAPKKKGQLMGLGYLNARAAIPFPANKGERIIGSRGGQATLYRLRVGKGQLIYLGWEISAALPGARGKVSAVDQEKAFEEQMQLLFNIVSDVYPAASQ